MPKLDPERRLNEEKLGSFQICIGVAEGYLCGGGRRGLADPAAAASGCPASCCLGTRERGVRELNLSGSERRASICPDP